MDYIRIESKFKKDGNAYGLTIGNQIIIISIYVILVKRKPIISRSNESLMLQHEYTHAYSET